MSWVMAIGKVMWRGGEKRVESNVVCGHVFRVASFICAKRKDFKTILVSCGSLIREDRYISLVPEADCMKDCEPSLSFTEALEFDI